MRALCATIGSRIPLALIGRGGRGEGWLLLSLTLLALLLRLWRMDAQSLWLDEAMSWWWAKLPPLETLARGLQIAGDPHPPLYYLALHLWSSAFGDGEGSLRAFSIVAGTLLVLPVYGLGRRLFSPVVGAIAGLLVAVNPFLIWYSQEVRMYALLGLLCASAAYALWRGLNGYDSKVWGDLQHAPPEFPDFGETAPSPSLPRWGRGWGGGSPSRWRGWGGGSLPRWGRGWGGGSPSQREGDRGRASYGQQAPQSSELYPLNSPSFPTPTPSLPPKLGGKGRGKGRGWGTWWLLYLLLTVAALYTHFYAALLLPFHVLFTLLFWRAHRRALAGAFLAWFVAGLAYLPWAIRAWSVSGTSLDTIRTPLPDMIVALLQGWSLRAVPDQGWTLALLLAPFVALLLLGLWPRRGEGRALAFLVLWLTVPLIEIAVLSYRDPIFGVQYAIAFAPAFYLLLARGVINLGRRFSQIFADQDQIRVYLRSSASYFFLLAVVGASLYGLGQNANPVYRKEDWRSLARYVREHEGPRDAVLCVVDYARIPFEYYYRDGGRSPVFYPFGAAIQSEESIAPTLVGLEAYDTIWLVESHEQVVDPGHLVRGHLSKRWPVVTEQFPVGAQLRAYAVRYRLDTLPADATPTNAVFDGRLRLAGFRVDQSRLRATDDVFHPPSNWLHVTLYWQPVAPLEADYRPHVELSGNGLWGGSLDRPTQITRFYPPGQWAVGEIVRDEHDVNLNPATPPGVYRLAVRVSRPAGSFLLTDGLDYLLLPGEITILP